MSAYLIVFRRNDRIGSEEYDGGNTLADARKEAAFFCAHLPANISVRICQVNERGRLRTVEYARDSNQQIEDYRDPCAFADL